MPCELESPYSIPSPSRRSSSVFPYLQALCALFCKMSGASPRPLSQMPSHLMNNITAVTTHWDPWAEVAAKIMHVFLLSHTAVNLAVSGISIESTQSHIHIYFTLCTGDVPLRDFQTKLGFIPSIFILDLTLQHYSASMPSWWTIPARCHPKVSLLEGGFDDNHREKRLSRKLVRSTKRWAASVMTARLPAMCPPRGYRTR